MNTPNLSARMHEIVVSVTDEYRRYKQLESLTDIPADTWKSWFHGRQRPTAEMIEAVAIHWPQYAFWLVTGITDSKYGHIGPTSAYDNYLNQPSFEQPLAEAYFRKKLLLSRKAFTEGRQPDDLELDDINFNFLLREHAQARLRDQEKRVQAGADD